MNVTEAAPWLIHTQAFDLRRVPKTLLGHESPSWSQSSTDGFPHAGPAAVVNRPGLTGAVQIDLKRAYTKLKECGVSDSTLHKLAEAAMQLEIELD